MYDHLMFRISLIIIYSYIYNIIQSFINHEQSYIMISNHIEYRIIYIYN